MPSITGPGTCIADDVVQLISVWSHRGDRIVNPPAMLRCGMAEVLADWVREVPVARGIGSTMTELTLAHRSIAEAGTATLTPDLASTGWPMRPMS